MPESLGSEPVPIPESLDSDTRAESAPMPETSVPMPEKRWFRCRGGIFPDAEVESVPRPETSALMPGRAGSDPGVESVPTSETSIPMSESFDSDTGVKYVPTSESLDSDTGVESASMPGQSYFGFRSGIYSEIEDLYSDARGEQVPRIAWNPLRSVPRPQSFTPIPETLTPMPEPFNPVAETLTLIPECGSDSDAGAQIISAISESRNLHCEIGHLCSDVADSRW